MARRSRLAARLGPLAGPAPGPPADETVLRHVYDAVFANAEGVRRELEARAVEGPDGSLLRATVSAGYATLDPEEATKEALLQAADAALARAKRGGRNRVVAG